MAGDLDTLGYIFDNQPIEEECMRGIVLLVALMGFCGLWILAMRRPSSWQILLTKTMDSGDLEPLFTELMRKPELVQPRFFDEAMHWLIQSDLDLAAQLTVRFVATFPDHKVSQDWLERMCADSDTTHHFSSEFLERYRRSGCTTGAG